MSQQLISRSPDLKRLRDEGYEIQVKGGHLIAHQIPYVNSRKEIKFGKLVSTLVLSNDVAQKPDTHVIHFMGEQPCNRDGTVINAIQHSSPNQTLFDGIVLNHSFSNKPQNGYSDYYEKMTRYIQIISDQAISIDSSLTPKTFKLIESEEEESVFRYIDTNTSRANLNWLNAKFEKLSVGIIGLGGTGAYILDQVAKTAVSKIHIFDGDLLLQHNAFRSPGAPSIDDLALKPMKVDYYCSMYSKMHKGIEPHAEYVTEQNIEALRELNFVFVCIDSNAARSKIITWLRDAQIPFIDVGLGVNLTDDSLVGQLRVTLVTPAKYDHVSNRIGAEAIDDNEYATNIQIADLNALNALLAVGKWKKWVGFYQDLSGEHNSTFSLNTGQLLRDDFAA